MGDIDLFYEVKNLFNTSEKAFNLYDFLRCTTRYPNKDKILYIVINERAKIELLEKFDMFMTFKPVNKNVIELIEEDKKAKKYIEIRTIEEIARMKCMDGKQFGSIRFYQ